MVLRTEGLDKLTRDAMALPGVFAKARKRALSSTGYFIMKELRAFIESGGHGWPAVHALTGMYRQRRGQTGGRAVWVRLGQRGGPLEALGKFARYAVDAAGTVVDIALGKSKRGQPGRMDPMLTAWALRAEEGATIPVSERTRGLWGATKGKLPRRGRAGAQAGADYFALRKGTAFLKIPKRPIFGPLFRMVEPKIIPHFQAKFWESVVHYRARSAKGA